MADVPKRYVYKAYTSGGSYIGNLPNVTSDFSYGYDIDTAGVQISIDVGVSADTAYLAPDSLTDESSNILTDESGNTLTDEGQTPIVAPGTDTRSVLIKNGNKIKVYEYSSWHPNGICVFLGVIEHIEATFGGTGEDKITVLCYSDGQDMDNILIHGYGAYVLDQSQTSVGASDYLTVTNPAGTLTGQTFTTGSNVNNIGQVTLHLAAVSTTNAVTLHLCLSPGGTELGTATVSVSSTTAADYNFIFSSPIALSPSTRYFIYVTASDSNGVNVYSSASKVYAGGGEYDYTGSVWVGPSTTQDMYFKTYSAPLTTISTYTNQDPTTGMLEAFMNDYATNGGVITYNSGTIGATGLSLSYSFNTNTVFEGLKAIRSLSPDGFYFTVDLGTDVLTFKRASAMADITLVKGLHIEQLTLILTIENIKNTAYFSGGLVSGNNIYTQENDGTSVNLYGQHLDRLSDVHVTNVSTARQVAQADVARYKDEQYQTTVTISDKTMDTSSIKPGMVVGFRAFGTFVDNLLAQVVRVEKKPEEVTLTLGLIPPRLHAAFERVVRGLVAEQTINNPNTPS